MKFDGIDNAMLMGADGELTPSALRIDDSGCVEVMGAGVCSGLSLERVYDAQGKWMLPGLVDLRTTLGAPSFEHRESMERLQDTAVSGGFTTLGATPYTDAACDGPSIVADLKSSLAVCDRVDVVPTAFAYPTEQVQQLSWLRTMLDQGVRFFWIDGRESQSFRTLRRALEYLRGTGARVSFLPIHSALANSGIVREGPVATAMGVPGEADIAETVALYAALEVARHTEGALHIGPVSTGRGVDLVRQAKQSGLDVTCDATMHHFLLDEDASLSFDSATRLEPCLKTRSDSEALWKGLADGTIDVVCPQHTPLSLLEKDVGFSDALPGALGLQTCWSMLLDGAKKHGVSTGRLLDAMSRKPAQLLEHEPRGLEVGAPAKLFLYDPERQWTWDSGKNLSRSSNCPYFGRELTGQVEATLYRGELFKNQNA